MFFTAITEFGMNESAEVLARSRLRTHFLRTLSSLASQGRPCSVHMVEGPSVTGVLRAADLELEHLGVSQLATPIGVLPSAILRTNDIVSVVVNFDRCGDPDTKTTNLKCE